MGGNTAESTIPLTVNGERRHVAHGATVGALLRDLGLPSERIAVERNREILDPSRLESTVLSADDSIEIVHFVGGG